MVVGAAVKKIAGEMLAVLVCISMHACALVAVRG